MSMQTVYVYDIDGVFTEVYNAQESPLEPGVYLAPTRSTPIEPPALAPNQAAVFVNGSWKIELDYRGKTAYAIADGSEITITQAGALPAGYTVTPPPPPPATGLNEVATYANGIWSIIPDYRGYTIYKQSDGTSEVVSAIGAIPAGYALTPPSNMSAISVAEAAAAQISGLHVSYIRATYAPVSFQASGATAPSLFPQDATSVDNLARIITAGEAAWIADGLNLWIDANSRVVTPFTFADLKGLAAAIEARDVPEYKHLLTQVAAVQAAANAATSSTDAAAVTAIQAITF